MTTQDTHRIRARDAINAARRGNLPKPRMSPTFSSPTCSSFDNGISSTIFETARENSIEVYDDKFERNTILTRSARMRKFKFYQYKPVQESPVTPKTTTNGESSWSYNKELDSDHPQSPRSTNNPTSHKNPLLVPRDDVLQGKVALVAEQSKELSKLDEEIAKLEKRIKDLNNGSNNSSSNNKNVDNLDEIYDLVNKKNDLLRRQMQLNIIEQEKILEKANEELTKELRSLMSIDDSMKTKAQLDRQQHLYDQSLALVNKRNELVHHMDEQERCIEEDNALKATLKTVISSKSIRSGMSNNKRHDQNCIIQ